MCRLLFATVLILCGTTFLGHNACASTNALDYFDRTIIKEPVYQSTPKYCLISLGDHDETRVWMVEDGKRLFVDKNGNGDLTDDGPPLEPSHVRNLQPNFWDFEYLLDAITPTNGTRHTSFVLRRWNYRDPNDSYGLSLSVNGRLPMYAGWFGTFWSTNRESAPVVHFGGPFTPKLLRSKAFTIGESLDRLSLGFFNPGSGPGAESRLSIEALPPSSVPELRIEWPAINGTRLRTSHLLTERCCYWEFYSTGFELPSGVVAGQAKISVVFNGAMQPMELTTTNLIVPVLSAKRGH